MLFINAKTTLRRQHLITLQKHRSLFLGISLNNSVWCLALFKSLYLCFLHEWLINCILWQTGVHLYVHQHVKSFGVIVLPSLSEWFRMNMTTVNASTYLMIYGVQNKSLNVPAILGRSKSLVHAFSGEGCLGVCQDFYFRRYFSASASRHILQHILGVRLMTSGQFVFLFKTRGQIILPAFSGSVYSMSDPHAHWKEQMLNKWYVILIWFSNTYQECYYTVIESNSW